MSKLKLQRRALEKGAFTNPAGWTAKRNVQTDKRYEALLDAFLQGGGISDADRRVVDKYRSVHVVDEDAHVRALKKVGWSAEEVSQPVRLRSDERLSRIKRWMQLVILRSLLHFLTTPIQPLPELLHLSQYERGVRRDVEAKVELKRMITARAAKEDAILLRNKDHGL